ncbi:MAG: hypothetical protein KF760_03145 [Candidatus Eremiobacteraeota bacterium]|nr:hypothetical protein [Candidatus Eremiobacteraeota bacterium]
MNLNSMGGYAAIGGNYGAFPVSYPFQSQPLSAGPGQMLQMLMQLLQAFNSLQSSWAQTLGHPGQPSQAYAPQPVPFPSEPSPPAYQAPAPASAYVAPTPAPEPATNLAVAVNLEAAVATPEPVVEVAAGGDGGDGGGDGGDPVILDLNGDNKLDVTGANGGKINFNLFGNGTNVKTEWLKAGTEDGLLVSDFNGDGKIDSGRELMRTTGVNGEQGKYKGGWDKLSQLFDKNKDGKVSGDELNELKVWVDKNGDGVSDEGELRSVKELGISSIDIPTEGVKSNFTMNGKQQMAEDYVFDLAK